MSFRSHDHGQSLSLCKFHIEWKASTASEAAAAEEEESEEEGFASMDGFTKPVVADCNGAAFSRNPTPPLLHPSLPSSALNQEGSSVPELERKSIKPPPQKCSVGLSNIGMSVPREKKADHSSKSTNRPSPAATTKPPKAMETTATMTRVPEQENNGVFPTQCLAVTDSLRLMAVEKKEEPDSGTTSPSLMVTSVPREEPQTTEQYFDTSDAKLASDLSLAYGQPSQGLEATYSSKPSEAGAEKTTTTGSGKAESGGSRRKQVLRFGETTVYEITTLTRLEPRKHHFYEMGVTAGAFVVIFFSVLVVYIATRKRTTMSKGSSCDSDECKRAITDLEDMIDPATHPCVDFYRHVCNKWTMRYNIGTVSITRSDAFKMVTNALLFPPAKSALTIPRYFREFYTACYSFPDLESTSSLSALLQPLQGHSDILGMGNFSLFLEHAIFLSLEWGIDVVFTLGLVSSMDSTYLRFSPARSLLEKLDPSRDSLDLVDQLRPLLDFAVAGTTLTTSVATILELDKALKPDAMYEPSKFFPVTILSRLGNFLHTTRWLRCINSLLPMKAHVNTQSVLVTEQFTAIERAIATIYSAGSDGLVYAYLQVLAELARFSYRGRGRNDDARSASVCFFAGAEVFGHSWARMFIELTSPGSPCHRTETIFRQLVQLSTNSHALAWMDKASRNVHRLILSGVRLHLYRSTDAAGSDAMWGPAIRRETFPDDFLQAKREAQKRSLDNPRSLLTDLKDSLLFSGRVSYSGSLSAVVVPPISSSWPFCTSEEVPLEFDLGMLGVLMAIEMSRAPFVHFRGGTRGLEYGSEIRGFADCIRPIAQAVLGVPPNELSKRGMMETFLWVRGVRLAHQLLNESLFKAGITDSRDWRNAHTTFFKRFCRLTCATRTEPDGLSAEARCLLPLANIPEFAIAFECPVPSRMTHNTCQVL